MNAPVAHADRDHAEYAPSAAYRWLRCHGSVPASQGITQRSSIYAEEGTACHEAASRILEGESFDHVCRDLSQDQRDIVEEYTEFCFYVAEAMQRYGKPQVMVERRMRAPGISGKFFGTGDFLVLSGGVLRVVDLKAGAVPVYVRDHSGRINPQLASYVLLALAELGAPVSPWHFDPGAIGIDTIKLSIVQPRVFDEPQTTRVEFDELEEFLGDLVRAIDAIEGGDTTRMAGEWCKFCPAKGTCPELRQEAVRRARIDFDDGNIPFEEWAAVLAEAEMIAAHVNGIREHIRRAVEQGREVPGFKLVQKRALKKWINWGAAEARLIANGFPMDQLYRRTPISPAGAIKLGKARKNTFDVSELFETVPSGVTVVSEGDPRPALVFKPGADFADDDTEE